MTLTPEAEPAPLLLRPLERGPARAAAVALLAEAGRSERHVWSWCDEGEVFALCDPTADADAPPAAALLIERLGGGLTAEVRLLVVAPAHRGRRLGSRLLAEAGNVLRADGARRLVACAVNTDLNLMWLYQRAGFRFSHVERDGCLPERGWEPRDRVDGVARRDVVWFDQAL